MDNQEENKEALNKDNPQGGSSTTQNADEQAQATERLKQQLAGSSQEALRLKTLYDSALDVAVDRVAGDNSYLLELSKKDPDLAKDVAKKWWDLPLDKAIEKITTKPADKKDESPLDKETMYKEFAERIRREFMNEGSRKEADELFNHLSGEEKTAAEGLFKDITAGRDLTPAEARQYAEMATLYAQKGKIVSGKADLNIAMFGSTGNLGRGSSQPAPENKGTGEDLAASLGLGHLYSKK